MANPARWLWDRARGVFNRLRGDRIDKVVEPTPILRDRYLEMARRDKWLDGLATELFGGKLNVQQWELAFRQRLKVLYIGEYTMAKGGRANMTQADWDNVDRMLTEQARYLSGFAADIRDGKLTEAQAAVRSDLYRKSARQAHERGKSAALGLPEMPAYPGDGSTQCLTNCQCHWDHRETELEWLSTWTLGAAEHCPDCEQRARDWAPYRTPK